MKSAAQGRPEDASGKYGKGARAFWNDPPAATPTRCACKKLCGDVPEADDRPNAVCEGLPIKREPLVEIVMVPR